MATRAVAFDVDRAFAILREATAALPKAAMFELRDEGFGSPYEQLVGALVSARSRDETTLAVCRRLFSEARTPREVVALGELRLVELLHGASFPVPKARDILMFSQEILARGGATPDTLEGLTAFHGVGPKIAALVLGVAFGEAAIAVDIHVHRIVNRWGYVSASTPEKTAAALAERLPRRYWVEINERLVPFEKFVCTGVRPKCSTCPLLAMCARVGVTSSR